MLGEGFEGVLMGEVTNACGIVGMSMGGRDYLLLEHDQTQAFNTLFLALSRKLSITSLPAGAICRGRHPPAEIRVCVCV